MDGILDLIKDAPMNTPTPAPVKKPDEAAQIVISQGRAGVIVRFKEEKKAKKTFEWLHAQWLDAARGQHIVCVNGDMFDTVVDLSTVLHMSLVIHKVASKFEPWRG